MPLGQEEIFTPPPTRKLIVPSDHVTWWGVDPSTLRVAISVILRDGVSQRVDMVSFPRVDASHRLVAIRKETLCLAEGLAADRRPGVIVVEKPAGFGDRPNPELAYAAGVLMCALQEAVPGAKLELVEGSKWKKAACGSGSIKKPKPTSGVEYPVLSWARQHGYSGSSWDEADAWAIAEYARRTYALEQR